jgi:hypothetical protein
MLSAKINITIQTILFIVIVLSTLMTKKWSARIANTDIAAGTAPKDVNAYTKGDVIAATSPFHETYYPKDKAGVGGSWTGLGTKVGVSECQKKTQNMVYAGLSLVLVGWIFGWVEVMEGAKINRTVSGLMSLTTFIGYALLLSSVFVWDRASGGTSTNCQPIGKNLLTDPTKAAVHKGIGYYMVVVAAVSGLILSFAEAYEFVENFSKNGHGFDFEF